MTTSQALGLLAGAALVALIGLVLYVGSDGDGRDLGSVAFAGAVVMAIASLGALFRNLYGSSSERT